MKWKDLDTRNLANKVEKTQFKVELPNEYDLVVDEEDEALVSSFRRTPPPVNPNNY
ncbi:hypothetical protein A2U01_0004642 [Trifolium medium]|uniref:Uncharacterized protein n=1 Tax=Trifolium medium TaxID=97028 RepID=A0A392M8R7_9FABA|nr:hypothetical protein [Trifolium medium]